MFKHSSRQEDDDPFNEQAQPLHLHERYFALFLLNQDMAKRIDFLEESVKQLTNAVSQLNTNLKNRDETGLFRKKEGGNGVILDTERLLNTKVALQSPSFSLADLGKWIFGILGSLGILHFVWEQVPSLLHLMGRLHK